MLTPLSPLTATVMNTPHSTMSTKNKGISRFLNVSATIAKIAPEVSSVMNSISPLKVCCISWYMGEFPIL